ncbi:hypothetical protein [Rhodococcus sp. HNM0569]|uniref:hypothetical protein n=1 Tax=Rhodococcus sp. HNM0569 TaxID=2716340 RepID=UPI00146D4CB2|nr:hypothetical protein [Rhodococcus sp. HNM0569]NLU82849.1 hypothetical protein [Rhodococcus sp. HNM0569]
MAPSGCRDRGRITSGRTHSRLTAVALCVGAAFAAVACGTAGAPSSAPGSPSAPDSPSAAAPPGTEPAPGDVTAAQAQSLCSDLEGQLQNWRTYTPTIGKGGLNIVVGTWLAHHNLGAIDFATDRGRIDTITSAACPQVRADALTALEIPDLASGLVGF